MGKLKNLKELEKLKPYDLTTEGSDNFFNFYSF